MKLAILSGKGGTGKTTVSTNIAYLLKTFPLVDTDVEEPNGHIFMKAVSSEDRPVKKAFPVVDENTCTLCGKCGDFCRFNTLLPAKNNVIVYKEMCHDCGGCEIVCPTNSISYSEREIGKITEAKTYFDSDFYYGTMNVGELSGVRIIENLVEEVSSKHENIIIDCPPGTSCATVAAVENADRALLVTEATPFGLSDMKMVVDMLEEMKIPFDVVINKYDEAYEELENYLEEKSINIIGRIPFKKEYAMMYSEGKIISEFSEDFKKEVEKIITSLPLGRGSRNDS